MTASPFVKVFQLIGVPAAAHLVNFVVITAAASSINCDLYLTSRMLFSLARGGYAPAAWGRVSKRGVPLVALMVSALGLAVALAIALAYPGTAYVVLFGVALFGGLFVWFMIFVTHLYFRRQLGCTGPAAAARAHDRLSVYFAPWRCRHRRDHDHDLVRRRACGPRCCGAFPGSVNGERRVLARKAEARGRRGAPYPRSGHGPHGGRARRGPASRRPLRGDGRSDACVALGFMPPAATTFPSHRAGGASGPRAVLRNDERRGTLDYELYLNTKALLSCQKDSASSATAMSCSFRSSIRPKSYG